MLAEVIECLAPASGGLYVDGTLGAGGHAEAILVASSPHGRLLGLDRDPQALNLSRERLKPFGDRVRLVEQSFDCLDQALGAWEETQADGILLDLGVSSMQLDQAARGFSLMRDAPLDMRMGTGGTTAADILAHSDPDQLAGIFARLGEEPFARVIARALAAVRQRAPITTTGQLARLVEEALPARERRKRKLHPATRVFMALRLAVNDELGRLARFLEAAPGRLRPGGRLAVISYHSLEDRLVKRAFAALIDPCTCPPDLPVCGCGAVPLADAVFKGAAKPSAREVQENPRSRSARLRAVRMKEAAGS